MLRAADNPFNTTRIAALRYRLPAAARNNLLQEASRLRAGALVGPPGHGKTTLLEDLAADCRAAGWPLHCYRCRDDLPPQHDPDWQRFCEAEPGAWYFLDSGERLGRWKLQRLCRQLRRAPAATLLITAHRPGRLPTLFLHRTDAELAVSLLAHFLPAASADWQDFVRRAWAELDGDLRAVWLACYDRCQELAGAPEAAELLYGAVSTEVAAEIAKRKPQAASVRSPSVMRRLAQRP